MTPSSQRFMSIAVMMRRLGSVRSPIRPGVMRWSKRFTSVPGSDAYDAASYRAPDGRAALRLPALWVMT